MPITLNCPKCHKPFRVRDESIGGRVRCPSCAAILQVPSSLGPSSLPGFELPAPEQQSLLDPSAQKSQPKNFPEELQQTPIPADDDILGVPSFPPKIQFGPPGANPSGSQLPAPPSIKLRGTPQAMSSNPIAPMSAPQAPQPYSTGSMMIPPIGSPGITTSGTSLIPPGGAAGMPGFPKLKSTYIPPATTSGSVPPAAGQPFQTPNRSPIPPVSSEWKSARSGLGMIQFGLLLLSIPFLGIIGHGVWAYLKPDQALSQGPGFTGRPELNFWKEIVLAYAGIPATLGMLFVFLGRIKCVGVPEHACARGLARGATLFTVLGVVGIAVAVVNFMGIGAKLRLLPESAPLSVCLAVPSALLADLFTLLFIAQAAWAVGKPNMLTSVAGYVAFALIVPSTLVAANVYLPVVEPLRNSLAEYGSPFAEPNQQLKIRFLVAGTAVCVYGFLMLFFYSMLARTTKKAIQNQFGA